MATSASKEEEVAPLSRAEVDAPKRHVYVVLAGPTHVKIGVAENVTKRVWQIQTGCPHKVRFYKAWSPRYAFRVERRAHQALAAFQSVGEWFKVPPRVAASIVDAIVRDIHRTVVFCRNCRHVVALDEPPPGAKYRCSRCQTSKAVGVVSV